MIDSNKISQNDRQDLHLNYNPEFTYGEIEPLHYLKLLQIVSPKEGEILWDLGSGVGKSLYAAALAYPSLVIKGIEFLPNLYKACASITSQFSNVEVHLGDIRDQDWSDADIIYISSLCFLDDLVLNIFEKCSLLKMGSRILTLKEFPAGDYLRLISAFRLQMSWDRSDCFYYEKIK